LSIGDSAAALADGEAAISAKADWAKGYSRKGAALHAMKKYDEAEAAYAAGLVAVPGDASLEAALKEVRVCEGGVGGLDPV
jgi:stress-induced-phosphoprotein 1